jgi:hypothetical protein
MKGTIICILLLFGFLSYARIGESEEQAMQRYGKIISQFPPEGGTMVAGVKLLPVSGERILRFQKEDFLIELEFYQNKCLEISYQIKYAKRDFTKQEIDGLLNANGNGLKWKEVADPDKSRSALGFKSWTRSDGQLIAELIVYDDTIRGGAKWIKIKDLKSQENRKRNLNAKNKEAINSF